MKKYLNPHALPLYSVLLGLFVALARLWLLRNGTDEKGLFITAHPAGILSILGIVIFLVILFLCSRPLSGKLHPLPNRLLPIPAGILGFASAFCLLLYGILRLNGIAELLSILYAVMTFICAVCLAWLGICRLKGRRVHYLFYVVITVYLILHLLCQYRQWSAEPQLLRFFFQLMASVTLILFAYQCACRRDGGNVRWYVFFHQSALFFCIAAMDGIHFYYFMALWLVSEQFGWKPSEDTTHEAA